MVANDAFAEIRAAAQVILNLCASNDEAHARLESVRYASGIIRCVAEEASKQFQTEQADGGQR